jgi:hypothetical protein
MSDEQTEPKRATRFGSIQQQRDTIAQEWSTVGGGKGMPAAVGTMAQKRQDVKTLEAEGEGMKRQTVYIPLPLATWLKAHAALIGDDISGIITRLVEQYREEVESKNRP